MHFASCASDSGLSVGARHIYVVQEVGRHSLGDVKQLTEAFTVNLSYRKSFWAVAGALSVRDGEL
eukprot:2391147-Pyramimonas_sp.AAC.1